MSLTEYDEFNAIYDAIDKMEQLQVYLKIVKMSKKFIIKIEQYNDNFKTTFNTIKIQNDILKDQNYQYEISNQYDLKINVLKYNENDLKLNEKDIFYQIKIKKTKTVPFTGNRKTIPPIQFPLTFHDNKKIIRPIQFPLTFYDNEIQEPIRFPLTFHDNQKIIRPIQFPLTFYDNEIQEPKRKKRKIDKNENKSKMEQNQLGKMYEDESSDDEIEQLIPFKFKLKLLKLNDKYVFQGQFQSLNLTDIQSFIGKVSTNQIENKIYDLTPNGQKINFQCNSNKLHIHLNFIKKNHIKKSIKELKKRDPINNLICYKILPPDECLEKDHRKTHQSCLILIFDAIIKNTINFINTKSKINDIVPLKSKKDNSNVKLWPHDINDIIILNPPWSLAFDWSMKAIYYVKSNEHGKVILILPSYSGQNNYTKDLQLHHRLRLEINNIRFGNYTTRYRYPVWVWCISKKENNDINKISAYTLNYNDIYQTNWENDDKYAKARKVLEKCVDF